jgi:hypothetical protein
MEAKYHIQIYRQYLNLDTYSEFKTFYFTIIVKRLYPNLIFKSGEIESNKNKNTGEMNLKRV